MDAPNNQQTTVLHSLFVLKFWLKKSHVAPLYLYVTTHLPAKLTPIFYKINGCVESFKEKKHLMFKGRWFWYCTTPSFFLTASKTVPTKTIPLKLYNCEQQWTTITVKISYVFFTRVAVLGVRFLRPLGGQKRMALKTVPLKPLLHKTFDRITTPKLTPLF